MTRGAHALLEPGALLSGMLFRDLIKGNDQAMAPGTRLGAFRVVRELGRGGMGIVHLGERDDGEFSQQVALKCLVDRDSAAGTELFRRERQILANLRHPNIARLLDGGRADDGRLWFAMEWVEGERVDLHCARAMLSIEDRLQLWLGVAEAVQFAHARLLIHRDIKPGNVLVDADGQPRLLDFGIASLSGDSECSRAFSPGHASPEQRAGLEVGTASDQYQLARLLERMLSSQDADGKQDTTSAVPAATSRVVAESEVLSDPQPEDPSVLAAGIDARLRRGPRMSATRRGELVAVLTRACSLDPARRYGSVAELKADVQRVLDRRPVDARHGRWSYAMACAVRRRPFTAMTTALTMLALIALVVGFNMRLARERDFARAETAKLKAINAFVSEDLLSSANPFRTSDPDLTMREALDRARQQVGTRFVGEPAIESELRETIGTTYAGVGELDLAKEQLEQSLALRQGFDSSGSVGAIAIRLKLAERAVAASDFVSAEVELQKVIAELETGRMANDEQLLAARIALVNALGALGKSEQALALDQSIDAQIAEFPPAHDLALDRADVRGYLLLTLGRADEAIAVYDKAAQISADAYGATDHRTLRSLEGKARALRDAGRLTDALPVLRDLYAKRLAIFGEEHRETLRNHNELAVALSRSGDRPEAIAIWEKDLQIKQRRLGSAHASTLSTRYNLGNELIASELYPQAEQAFRDLLALETSVRGISDPGAVITQMSLANAIGRQGRHAEAIAVLDAALFAGRETMAARPERGILLGYRSRNLKALGRIDEARREAQQAIDVFVATVGTEHRRTRQAREWLATLADGS